MQKPHYLILGLLFVTFTAFFISCDPDETDPMDDPMEDIECITFEQKCDVLCASELTIGQLTTGKIDVEGDQDFYALTLIEPAVIELNILDVPGDLKLRAYLRTNPQCVELEDEKGDTGEGFTILHLADAGTYIVHIEEDGNNGSSPEDYTFSVTLNTDDVYEINNNCESASPIQLDEVVEGAIYPYNDDDFYTFTITEPGVLNLDVINVPEDVKLQSDLMTYPDCAELKEWYPNDANEGYKRVYLVEPGNYALRMHHKYEPNASGYNPDLYSFEVSLDVSDIYEINNTCVDAKEIPINTIIYGAINPEQDEDFFKFDIPNDGVVTVEVLSVPEDIRLSTKFLNYPQCNVLEQETGNTAQGFTFDYSVTAGTYGLSLKSVSIYDVNPDLYSFRISF